MTLEGNGGESPLRRLPGRDRRYARVDLNRIVPSVTTVVSLTPKPYLLNWVVKLAAEFSVANIREVWRLVLLGGDEAATKFIKDGTRELREYGARRGTALHDYAEQYLWLGTGNPPTNRAQQAVVDILDQLQPNVLFSEAMVWNGERGYAGTLDGIWEVTFDGRVETWLVDWKTSKSRTAEWALQLEAYRRAQTIFTPQGVELPMPYIDRLVVLYTPYEGDWAVLPVRAGPTEWGAFLAALEVLNWHDSRKVGDVLGEPLYGLTSKADETIRDHPWTECPGVGCPFHVQSATGEDGLTSGDLTP